MKQAFLATGVVKEKGGYSTKRHRDGEHVRMQQDGFVRVGDTIKCAALKTWARMAILLNTKDSSDTAYGHTVSLNHWIQQRRQAIGLIATVAQEKSLKKANDRAEKAIEKVKVAEQKIAEKALKMEEREHKKTATATRKAK